MFVIKGDGNSLTLLWGLTSGQSRSCCFAHFRLKTGTVALQVAALLGYHFPYSGSVLKDVIVLACTHLAQETESKKGDSGKVSVFWSPIPHSDVSWYLRKYNLCQGDSRQRLL